MQVFWFVWTYESTTSRWIFSSQVVGCLTNGPSSVFFLPIIGEVANGKKLLCVSHTEDSSVSRDLSWQTCVQDYFLATHSRLWKYDWLPSVLCPCVPFIVDTLRQDVAVMEQNKSRDLWLNCLIKMIDGLDISITIMTIALLQLIRANCGWFACGAIPDPCYAVMCYVLCCPCQCPLPDPLGPSMPTSYTIACPQKVFTMCGCALLMAPFDMVLKCGAVVVWYGMVISTVWWQRGGIPA